MAFQRKKPEALGVKAPFPGFIEPALAASIDRVPSGERWIHEIKFDGYRVQVHLANEAVKAFSQHVVNGVDQLFQLFVPPRSSPLSPCRQCC